MRLRSRSRNSNRRSAPLPDGAPVPRAVRGSRTTGREPQYPERESLVMQRAAAPSNHYSPIAPFLIGSAAIRNAPNSSVINARCNSNRSRIACLRGRFSHVLHSRNQQPHRTTQACLIASRQILEIHLTCSQHTRKLFLIATLCRCLARSRQLATRQPHLTAGPQIATLQSLITTHKSGVTNHDSRYNHAFLRAAGQSNEKPRSAAGCRHPARHETGFGLRSSNIAALISRTTKDNA
jgi:hypothetical protein